MAEQNQNPPQSNPPTQTPVVSESPAAPPTPKPSLRSKLAVFTSRVKAKLPDPMHSSVKRLLILLAAIFVVVLLIALVYRIATERMGTKLQAPTPAPSPTETPVTTIPSVYANDQDVLRIEGDLTKLEKDLGSLEVREDNLQPPALDFEISFE